MFLFVFSATNSSLSLFRICFSYEDLEKNGSFVKRFQFKIVIINNIYNGPLLQPIPSNICFEYRVTNDVKECKPTWKQYGGYR